MLLRKELVFGLGLRSGLKFGVKLGLRLGTGQNVHGGGGVKCSIFTWRYGHVASKNLSRHRATNDLRLCPILVRL